MRIVAVLMAVGAAFRLALAQQSLLADELSTRFVIAGHGLFDMVSVVHTDAEITPPLYFALSWLTTRIELSPLLLRAPSLIAGIALIPLVYCLGKRTVGERAGVVAAALTTFSPFMVYYSSEARGYALMMALVVGSSLCLLTAIERGGLRWWAGYAACVCAAVYTHYTSVFVLAAQVAWVLWAHPRARRPVLLATAGAAIGFVPWLSGLRNDLNSPTTSILSALQPFNAGYVRQSLEHWAVGFPYLTPKTRLGAVPGAIGLVVLTAGALVAVAGIVGRRARLARPGADAVLVVLLALATPVGEAFASAVGSNLFGARNLAASWPAFAIALAAVLLAAGRRLGPAAAALVLLGFAIGAVKTLGPDVHRPDYDGVAAFIEHEAKPGDVVVDGASLSPDGVPSTLGIALSGRLPLYPLGRFDVRYDPFRIVGPPPVTADVVRRAADGRRRVFMVLAGGPVVPQAEAAVPAGYAPVRTRAFRGLSRVRVTLYAPEGPGA